MRPRAIFCTVGTGMGERAEAPRGDPKTRRVLVVDDDEGVLEMLCAAARGEGFQVCGAADGSKALEMVSQESFDLVVLDLMLPRLGGFEILRRLQGVREDLPVLVITGRYTDPSASNLIRQERNVAGFLEKPVRPAAFAAVLHGILKTSAGPEGGAGAGL